ncbi:hypothetical protein, partial [Burkholderia latens]
MATGTAIHDGNATESDISRRTQRSRGAGRRSRDQFVAGALAPAGADDATGSAAAGAEALSAGAGVVREGADGADAAGAGDEAADAGAALAGAGAAADVAAAGA